MTREQKIALGVGGAGLLLVGYWYYTHRSSGASQGSQSAVSGGLGAVPTPVALPSCSAPPTTTKPSCTKVCEPHCHDYNYGAAVLSQYNQLITAETLQNYLANLQSASGAYPVVGLA